MASGLQITVTQFPSCLSKKVTLIIVVGTGYRGLCKRWTRGLDYGPCDNLYACSKRVAVHVCFYTFTNSDSNLGCNWMKRTERH